MERAPLCFGCSPVAAVAERHYLAVRAVGVTRWLLDLVTYGCMLRSVYMKPRVVIDAIDNDWPWLNLEEGGEDLNVSSAPLSRPRHWGDRCSYRAFFFHLCDMPGGCNRPGG
jgi:hypothetical protein